MSEPRKIDRDDVARELWLARRRNGIGGSEVAAVLGRSPFASPLEIYVRKIERAENGDRPELRRGRLLEPGVLAWLGEELQVPVEPVPIELQPIPHPTAEFAFASPDGLVDDDGIAEAKTSRSREGWGEPGSDCIPAHYLMQAQWELACTGRDFAWVPVLFGGLDFALYAVERHDRLIDRLLNQVGEWWDRHVLRGVPPAPTRPGDNQFMARAHRLSTSLMLAAPEIEPVLRQLRDLRDWINRAKDQRDALEAQVKAYIGAAQGVVAGETVATWKPRDMSEAPLFDVKRAQADAARMKREGDPRGAVLAEMIETYTKDRYPSRALLVRDRKDDER